MRTNKYGAKDRREYKRLWARERLAKIYAARTPPEQPQPVKRGRPRKYAKPDQTGA